MRMTAVALIFLFGLLMIAAVYLAHTLVIVQRVAVVDTVKGRAEVFVHGRGDPVPLEQGKLVREGDVVSTGPDSSVELRWVRWVGGMRIKIGPNSRFTVKRARMNHSTKEEESRLRLDVGRIWVRLRSRLKGRSKFEVETPTVVAAVRGTIFSVSVAPDGRSRLQVYEGEVVVTGDEGATATLTSGSETAFTKGQRGSVSRPLESDDLAEWWAQASIVGPFLEVSSPEDGAALGADTVVVKGRAEPGSEVRVNGDQVEATASGEFSATIRLGGAPHGTAGPPQAQGRHVVEVTARDAGGRENAVLRTVSISPAGTGRAVTEEMPAGTPQIMPGRVAPEPE